MLAAGSAGVALYETSDSTSAAAANMPANTGASPFLDEADLPHPTLRNNVGAATRSYVRRPLALHHKQTPRVEPGTYWYGEPSFFKDLTATEKHNAYVVYAVGKALGKTTLEIGCTDNIAYHESHLEVHDPNPASQADGIPQANPASKMASAGPDWQNNPYTQVKWMYGYEDERYGGACGAWSFWQSNSYY